MIEKLSFADLHALQEHLRVLGELDPKRIEYHNTKMKVFEEIDKRIEKIIEHERNTI